MTQLSIAGTGSECGLDKRDISGFLIAEIYRIFKGSNKTMNIGITGRTKVLSLLPRRVRRWVMERRYHRDIEVTGEAELPYLRRMLAPGDLALDVGCNLGVYTYELSRITGHVIAFEPNPTLANLVRGLGLKGVEMRQVAASDHVHQTDLLVPRVRFGHALATIKPRQVDEETVTRIGVSTQRLDSVPGDVAFIKIDVEGFEEQALAGAEGILAKGRCIFLIEIEERHNPGGLGRIRDTMSSHGYAGFFLTEDRWEPVESFDISRYQDVEQDDQVGVRTRRSLKYVNNFLFVPRNKVTALSFLSPRTADVS